MKRIISLLLSAFVAASSFMLGDVNIQKASAVEAVQEQQIYFKLDFDDEYYGKYAPFNNCDNYADGNNIKTEVSSDGNRYLHYEKYASTYSYPEGAKGNANFRKIINRLDTKNVSKMNLHFDIMPKSVTDSSQFYVSMAQDRNTIVNFFVRGYSINNKEVFSDNSWTSITASYDFEKSVLTVYAGDDEIYKKESIAPKYFWQFGIQADKNYTASTYLFDNFYVYSGEPIFNKKSLYSLPYASMVNADKVAVSDDICAISIYGDSFISGQRQKNASLVFAENDEMHISVTALAKLLNVAAPSDGYLPFDEALSLFGYSAVYDNRGFVYWSKSGAQLNLSESDIWNVYNRLVYDRPDMEYLSNKSNFKNSHPRLSIEEGRIEEIKEELLNNGNTKWYYDYAKGFVEPYFKSDPKDTAKENTSVMMKARSIIARVQNLSLMYLITEDEKYKTRVWEELDVATSDAWYPHWQPNSGLDNAEMAAAIAYGYDWLYDYWDNDQRKQLEEALYNKALVYADINYGAEASSDNTWWVNSKNSNHNAVDNGGYILAALSVIDVYPELASRVLERAIRSLESFLNSFYADGGWVEGVTYWVYSMKYWAPAVRSLQISYGSDFSLPHSPGMENSVEFIIHACGLGANNFHDSGSESVIYQIGSLYNLAKIFNRPDFADIKLTYDRLQPTRRGLGTLLDFEESTTKELSDIPLKRDAKYERIGFVSMRENWLDDKSMFVSFHGGDSLPNHGHYDTGSFIYEYGGERFAIDLPSEDYSFSDRGLVYRGRAEGHNCLVINPDESAGHIKGVFSPIETFESGDYGAYSVLNMTPAYSTYAQSVKRGIKTENNRNSAIIRDEIKNLSQESSIYWFMHIDASTDVTINPDFVVLTKNGVSIKLEANTNLADEIICVSSAEPFSSSPATPGQADNSDYKKIVIKGTALKGDSTYIQVKLSPVSDDVAPMETKAFAYWTNPDLCEISYKTENGKKYAHIEIAQKGKYAFVAIYDDGELVSLVPATNNSYDGMSVSSEVLSGEKISTYLYIWESENSLYPITSQIPLG